jgi:ATP-dependent phosphofructokinase / diphosphate-dependent phosphofructokinase
MSRRGTAAALLLHSGGPTPVINASLLGVVEESRKQREIGRLYGAVYGLRGILEERFIDLFALSREHVKAIGASPSSALGSARLDPGEAELEQTLRILRAREIRYFFVNGGNGSMGLANELAACARSARYDLRVVGIPKTIDNDLAETDHSPGYGTTARFFAEAVRDIGWDNRALPGQVEFVEVLGRNAGWLVAATVLARRDPEDAPHLIYFPETRLPLERLLSDIDRVFRRLGRCVVAVCEGQLDQNGLPFGADVRKGSRGALAMNLGHRLAMLVSEKLKLKARSEKPGLLGRSAPPDLKSTDWEEARLCGREAVRAACQGNSARMITLIRDAGPAYSVSTGLAPLDRVAGVERRFPPEWRTSEENDVQPAFLEYVTPLTGAIRHYPNFVMTTLTDRGSESES